MGTARGNIPQHAGDIPHQLWETWAYRGTSHSGAGGTSQGLGKFHSAAEGLTTAGVVGSSQGWLGFTL